MLKTKYNSEWNVATPRSKLESSVSHFPEVPGLFSSILYLTIRLRARVFYEQIVNEAQPSWLSLLENEGE